MSTIFESGLYGNFSNPAIMNKSKQVGHSKQETISVIFTRYFPRIARKRYFMNWVHLLPIQLKKPVK